MRPDRYLPTRHELAKDYNWQNAELLNLGKDYPGGGYAYFKPRLHKAFASQAHLEDENAIREAIKRAEFVKKEIEALWVDLELSSVSMI